MRILITAGPTREPIDEVRYISNRSSGRMGLALAEAASAAVGGENVTLLLGPVLAMTGDRYRTERFTTAAELETLLQREWPEHDVLLMAAAVADYRPRKQAGKLKRQGTLKLELEPTPDLVAACAAAKRPDQRIIAFALEEPEALEERALEKMHRKGVDAIVANPLRTMEEPTITATLLWTDGRRDPAPPLTKDAFARWLLQRVIK